MSEEERIIYWKGIMDNCAIVGKIFRFGVKKMTYVYQATISGKKNLRVTPIINHLYQCLFYYSIFCPCI